jgi:ferredoxin--NADP+ reductase
MSRSIAIVGSGPAGFYAAEALARKIPGCRIDIIDRLPTPFGLVRFGVAPDHQGTKAVLRVFERTAQKDGVRFLGHVTVGRDATVAELGALYDAVVLAVGAPRDRRLGIPGEDLPGVVGSFAFVGWYNGHPDQADLAPDLNVRAAAIVGNGNVAIDVARVLAKTPAEMAKSDIAAHAAAAIRAAPIADLHMLGRRGPVEASFTNVELSELGRLERCQPAVAAGDLPAEVGAVDEAARKVKEANLATLREFAAAPPAAKPMRLQFHFHVAPVAIVGRDRVEAIRLARTRLVDGKAVAGSETFDIPCGLVVTCIGYESLPLDGVPFDAARGIVANRDGRAAPGLYVVGWARRGPSGVIATNRADAMAVADLVAADLGAGAGGKPGPAGLDALLARRGVRVVSYADWRRIDAAESAAATDGAPRRKLVRVADMLALLG